MQLIKDFTDIQRFVSFLNPEYQKKFLTEINSILVNLMDEQTRSPTPVEVSSYQTEPIKQEVKVIEQPRIVQEIEEKPTLVKSPMQQVNNPFSQDTSSGMNNLKNTFKSQSNNLPPPPSTQNLKSIPFNVSRTITSAPLNIKSNVASTANVNNKPQNKKPTMALVDSWSYIIPHITEIGIVEAQKSTIKTEVYQLMRQINNTASLKEVYLYLYPMSDPWAKFLETLYPLYRERCILLKKTRDFPLDVEIPLKLGDYFMSKGLINNDNLQKAIEYQKNPPAIIAKDEPIVSQISGGNWIDRAKSLMEQLEKPQVLQGNQPLAKKKIGEVFLELNMITKEELDDALTIQKWIRNLLDHAR